MKPLHTYSDESGSAGVLSMFLHTLRCDGGSF